MAFAFAGQWGPEPVVDRFGNAVYSATFRVLTTSGGEATVYTDRTKTTTTSQPLDVDGEGNATFYAAPGRYTIELTAGGSVTSFPVGVVPDAADVLDPATADAVYPRSGTATVVREAPLPLSKYAGADPTGASDSAPAVNVWIAALRTAGSRAEGIAPDGRYRLDSPILIKNETGADAPFPLIRGASRDGTLFSANHDTGDIFYVDGARHTSNKFFVGGGLCNMTLTQEAGRTALNGLRHNGWWRAQIADVLIDGLSGDGVVFPDLLGTTTTGPSPTTFTNEDQFSSHLWTVDRLLIAACGGWGMNNLGGGIGWGSMDIGQTSVIRCRKGGALIAGHHWKWKGGVVSLCGEDVAGGGITVAYQGNHLRDLIIEGVEFDGNHTWHLWLQAITGGRFTDNAFIHHMNLYPPATDNAPLYGVILGDAAAPTQTVRDLEIKRNVHRGDTTGAIVGYDFRTANAGFNSEFDNHFHATNPASLVRYQGHGAVTAAQRPKISDVSKVLLPGPSPRSYAARIVAAQNVESATTSQIVFENEESDQHGDGDPSLGYLTPWLGDYDIEAWVTISGLAAGTEVVLRISVAGAATKEVSIAAGGLTHETFSVRSKVRASAGNRITIAGRQTSGAAKAIRVGAAYNGFSVTPLVA